MTEHETWEQAGFSLEGTRYVRDNLVAVPLAGGWKVSLVEGPPIKGFGAAPGLALKDFKREAALYVRLHGSVPESEAAVEVGPRPLRDRVGPIWGDPVGESDPPPRDTLGDMYE